MKNILYKSLSILSFTILIAIGNNNVEASEVSSGKPNVSNELKSPLNDPNRPSYTLLTEKNFRDDKIVTNSGKNILLNKPLLMTSYDTNNSLNSREYLSLTKYAGLLYPVMDSNRKPDTDSVVFERSKNGVLIRSAYTGLDYKYVYFNISKRGYIYLDKKENAKEFIIGELPQPDSLYSPVVALFDAQTRQGLGTFRSSGTNYITIGPGKVLKNWSFL